MGWVVCQPVRRGRLFDTASFRLRVVLCYAVLLPRPALLCRPVVPHALFLAYVTASLVVRVWLLLLLLLSLLMALRARVTKAGGPCCKQPTQATALCRGFTDAVDAPFGDCFLRRQSGAPPGATRPSTEQTPGDDPTHRTDRNPLNPLPPILLRNSLCRSRLRLRLRVRRPLPSAPSQRSSA